MLDEELEFSAIGRSVLHPGPPQHLPSRCQSHLMSCRKRRSCLVRLPVHLLGNYATAQLAQRQPN